MRGWDRKRSIRRCCWRCCFMVTRRECSQAGSWNRRAHDSIAFRYIAANTHPDHDTIATFRKRFLKQLKPLFLQILLLAKTMGFLKLGKISLDGSKVQANASKHSALSWGHAVELEKQLKEEVARLMAMAEAA